MCVCVHVKCVHVCVRVCVCVCVCVCVRARANAVKVVCLKLSQSVMRHAGFDGFSLFLQVTGKVIRVFFFIHHILSRFVI